MELQRERRYNKKSMKRKKVIPMQQTLPPAAADAERHRQERRAFLYLPLLALAVTVVVELFNHKSFTDGPAGFWRFMTEEPLAFLVNFLIVLLTLCPAFFSAAAGVLVRIGVLLVADLRRRERVHPPQPYDALHRGGSDGV